MTATAEHPDDSTPALHIVPLNDWREHVATCTCWCMPVRDEEEPDVWRHNAMDQRDKLARGEIYEQ